MNDALNDLLKRMGALITRNQLSGIDNSTVVRFEEELARLAGCEHAISTSSGAIGLSLALEAARVGPGHEVILPALCVFGDIAAVVRRGATAVIVDVDSDRLTLSPEAVKAAMSTRTRAVIAVHAMGIPPDVAGLRRVVDGAFILEDASQGFPGPLLGDAAAIDLGRSDALVSLGEGGAVLTADPYLGERIRRAANLGHVGVRLDGRRVELSGGHDSFGTVARLPALQAAVGLHALKELKHRLLDLRDRASRVMDAGLELGLTLLHPSRLPNFVCFRGDARQRELLAQRGYQLRAATVYPAHTEPACLRHKLVRVCPTPQADTLAQGLVTLDIRTLAR